MIARRRLTLQLTPLLDMLLIIIFAQYMQVREQQTVEAQTTDQAVTQRDDALRRISDLLAQLERLRQATELAEANEARARNSIAEESRKVAQSQADLDRALAHQQVLGDVMVELFRVSPDDLAKVLDPNQFPSLTKKSPEELEHLRQRFLEVGKMHPQGAIELLLSFEELRKRSDVWFIRIDESSNAAIVAGERSTNIRVNWNPAGVALIDQFVDEVVTWCGTLPDPNSLVVIMVSFDRRTPLGTSDPVREALPVIVSRLRQRFDQRIRFEFSDMGVRL